MNSSQPRVANILGAGRAEADGVMLARAFVETADYQAIVQTDDFNFVVGRRGVGKSALFSKTREHFANDGRTAIVAITPPEHDTMEMQRLLSECGTAYRTLRAVSRLAWKVHLLITAAKSFQDHYRVSKSPAAQFLAEYLTGILLSRALMVQRSAMRSCGSECCTGVMFQLKYLLFSPQHSIRKN